MQFCKRCLFKAVVATPITFDKDGVCTGCLASIEKNNIDWNSREELFRDLTDQYRTQDGYDCILPVSGGKDSYFAAHVAKKLNLKSLMVTYHGNNYLPEGERNLNRMKDEFNFDFKMLPKFSDLCNTNHIISDLGSTIIFENNCTSLNN